MDTLYSFVLHFVFMHLLLPASLDILNIFLIIFLYAYLFTFK